MTDAETLSVYAESASRYADRFALTEGDTQAEDMTAFLKHVPDSGRVLDLGCGPGHWAAEFARRGYLTETMDASPAMAAIAQERFGLKVRIAAFDALDDDARYDGVWANFSLLHAPRSAFPTHLRKIRRALKPGGTLLIGMKLGTGEGRDHLGRFYSYYSEDELKVFLTDAGFAVGYTRLGHGKGLAGSDDPFAVMIAHG